MSPEPSWSSQFNKPQMKEDLTAVEWKNFFNQCLMHTEVFKKSDMNSLLNDDYSAVDPNFQMDVRHEMARNYFSKNFPIPKEKIQTEARNLLRVKIHKEVKRKKEEILVKKEIERLKQLFENYRHSGKKELEDYEKVKHPTSMPKFAKRYTKLWKRFECCDGFREIDTWFNRSLQMTMETKLSPSGVPFDVKIQFKKRHEEKEMDTDSCSEPISHNQKGSVINYEDEIILHNNAPHWNHSRDDGKREIMQRFFQSNNEIERIKQIIKDSHQHACYDKPVETFTNDQCTNIKLTKTNQNKNMSWRQSYDSLQLRMDKRKMENAWKTWRSFTIISKKRKEEKVNFESKIETFLEKYKEREKDLSKKENKTKLIKREKTVTVSLAGKMEEQKKRISEKDETLRKVMQEVKESQKEMYEKLVVFEKQNGGNNMKIRLLKTLTNVFEKAKTPKKKTYPVPEVVERMEKRREERANRWREIQDRKKKLEEEKAETERENERQKELMKAEEKKKRLEQLKEKRRLEKENEKIRIREKEKMASLLKLADENYEKVLLRSYGFRPWRNLINLRNLQANFALEFHENKLMQKMFVKWWTEAKNKAEMKTKQAEEAWEKILKRRSFRVWVEVCIERRRQFQVAVDWNDFKVTEKVFTRWRMFIKEEQLRSIQMQDTVDVYYKNKLKTKYLKLWRFYPELKKQEAAKEERKRIWRQKVQEILPDYHPMDIFSDSYHS